MFSEMGSLLQQESKRWSARLDVKTGAWEILDLWSDSLKGLTPEDNIPNDSKALTVLPADAFNALVEEANRLGLLARLVGPPKPTEEKEESRQKVEVPEESVGVDSQEFYTYDLNKRALEVLREITASSNVQRFVKPK